MSDEALLEDGTPVTIETVLAMTPEPSLRCAGIGDDDAPCEQPLHVRARDSDLVAAHFVGHHIDGCNHGSVPTDDQPGDAGHLHVRGPRASRWKLNLDNPAPTTGPTGRRRPNDAVEGATTRRNKADMGRPAADTSDVHSLANVLIAAIENRLPEELALPGAPYRPAADVVVHIADATADRFATGPAIVWGHIAGTRATQWGGTILLLHDAAEHLAVLIPKELRVYFPLGADQEFVGRAVMTLGSPSGTPGKQYLRIPSERSVAFNPGVRIRRNPVTDRR
jgi:hypothetical protein